MKPIILLTWFSPQMVAVKDFHIEIEALTQKAFESLVRRNAVQANFPSEEHVIHLEKYLGEDVHIPRSPDKYMRLHEGSKVIWVTRDQKTKRFKFAKVVISRRPTMCHQEPLQQELAFD